MNDKPEDDKDLMDIINVEDALSVDGKYAGDVSIDELLSEEANTLTPEDKKKIKQVAYGAGGIIIMLIVLSIFSFQPKKGPMSYGICSTFLEMSTPYPNTLQYTDLEGSRTALRIYFTSIDPFGEYKLEMMECTFGPDEKTGMKLTQVTRNRRPVDAETVRKFNATLSTVIESKPYLVMPPEWKNQLVQDNEP